MHIFWECSKLKNFWKAIHDLTVKVMETPLDITPIRYLFGTELAKTLDPTYTKRIGIICSIAKKCILLNWNQQRPPTVDLFKQILNETLRLEQRTYILKNKGDAFLRLWEPLMDLWHPPSMAGHALIPYTTETYDLWPWFNLICYFLLFIFFFPFFTSLFCCICPFVFCLYSSLVLPMLSVFVKC